MYPNTIRSGSNESLFLRCSGKRYKAEFRSINCTLLILRRKLMQRIHMGFCWTVENTKLFKQMGKHVDSNLEVYIDTSIVVCIGMYWNVLVCMSTHMLVFDLKSIVNTPTWCHTALESTFSAIFTVDTAVMSFCLDFQFARWSEGKTMAQELM